MDADGWLAEAACENWISAFTLFEEFTLRERGVIAGVYPQIPVTLVNSVF